MNRRNAFIFAILALVVIGILGCHGDRFDSSEEVTTRFSVASAEHPKGARFSRSEAVRIALKAVNQLGYQQDPHQKPVAMYYGTFLGGRKNKDWGVSFHAVRDGTTSGFLIYVDDRDGTTEVVGPSKP